MDEKEKMPQVTFLLLTYNQEKYVKHAVESALNQEYKVLQIIISDDHSTDKTFDIVKKETENYKGDHQVILNRNEKNLGLIDHLNKILKTATGELIILAAGDDISFPNRTKVLIEAYLKNGKPMLLHSKGIEIDINNKTTGNIVPRKELRGNLELYEAIRAKGIYLGASGAWSKELIEKYGPIDYKDSYEDLIMGFRALLEESILFIDEKLIYYRIGNGVSTIKASAFSQAVKSRKKKNYIRIGVSKQRIDDCEKVNIGCHKLEKSLTKQKKEHEIIDAIYSLNACFFYFFISDTKEFLKLLWSEMYWILRTFYRLKIGGRRTNENIHCNGHL